MAITTSSDSNVEITQLTSAPVPLDIHRTEDSLDASRFRRDMHDLETVCSGLTGDARDELAATISSLKSQFNVSGVITPNLAMAIEGARTKAAELIKKDTDISQAALFDAIASLRSTGANWLDSYRLDAAGERAVSKLVETIKTGSNEEIALAMAGEPKTPESEKGAQEFGASKKGAKLIEQIKGFQNGTPEEQAALLKVLQDREKMKQAVREIEQNDAIDSDVKTLVRKAFQAQALKGEEGAGILAMALSGRKAEDIKPLIMPQIDQQMQKLVEQFNAPEQIYSNLPGCKKEILASLPEHLKAKAGASDAGLAEAMAEVWMKVDYKDAKLALERAHGDLSKLSPEMHSYLVMRESFETVKSENATEDTVEQAEKKLGRGKGRYHGNENEHYANFIQNDAEGYAAREALKQQDVLTMMRDGNASIADCARAAYSEFDAGKDKGKADTKDYATGMAAMVFAYAKTLGENADVALAEYQKRSAGTSPADRIYQGEFQAFIDKQVGTLEGDYSRMGQEHAIEALGRQIAGRQVELIQDASGKITFYNNNDYTMRSTFIDNRIGLAGLGDDHNSMLRDMLRDARKISQTGTSEQKEFAGLLRKMDIYRLQYDKEFQPLVTDMYFATTADGRGTSSERIALLRAGASAVEAKITEYQNRYSVYSANILRGAEDEQRAQLAPFITNGQINVAALMQKVEDNKVLVGGMYQQFLDIRTTDLRAENVILKAAETKDGIHYPQVTSHDLANARMLAEIANQFRGADAIDNLVVRSADIERDIEQAAREGKPIPPRLQAEHDLLHIMDHYNPATATAAEKEALTNAVRAFLERDPYIAEKELNDKYFSDPRDRADIVNSVVNIVVSNAKAHGQTLTAGQVVTNDHGADHDDHAPAQSAVQAVSAITEEDLVATVAPQLSAQQLQDIQSSLPKFAVINENEGAGLLDKIDMDKFEKDIFNAIKDLSAEARRTMFGESQVLNGINKGAQGADAIYSYNEIETALKRLKMDGIEHIADSNSNGVFDAEDIQAALMRGNVPANGQGNGR